MRAVWYERRGQQVRCCKSATYLIQSRGRATFACVSRSPA